MDLKSFEFLLKNEESIKQYLELVRKLSIVCKVPLCKGGLRGI
jgi:hypothetical protein